MLSICPLPPLPTSRSLEAALDLLPPAAEIDTDYTEGEWLLADYLSGCWLSTRDKNNDHTVLRLQASYHRRVLPLLSSPRGVVDSNRG